MKIGPGEIILIVIIAIIMFGAGKIPEIGKQMGRGIRDFKKYSSGTEEEKALAASKSAAAAAATESGATASKTTVPEPTPDNQETNL